MEKTLIRPYRPEDLDDVVALVRELQGHDAARFDRSLPVDAIGPWYVEALLKACGETRGALLVAERAAALVGYAAVMCVVASEDIDDVAYTYAKVSDLLVAARFRGQGIGRQLLDACEQRARAAGARWLRITAMAGNARARDAYERFGFRDLLVDMEKPLD